MRRTKSIFLRAVFLWLALFTVSCGKDDKKAAEKPAFSENTVFTVNKEEVSIGQWNLYAVPSELKISDFYGESIWEYETDASGRKFKEDFLENIKDRIVDVKLVSSRAGQLGIELTEDDRTEISVLSEKYYSKLTEEDIRKYGITEDDVKIVCRDNYIANKVYENITLNVDDSTEDAEVRHMTLRYIMLSKSYENRDGETEFYSEDELSAKKSALERIRKSADENENVSIKDFEGEEFVVNEITSDLAGLKERLPEDEANIVFGLEDNEVSGIFETPEAFFLFECVDRNEPESTKAARIRIIEQREQHVFEEAYNMWKKEVKVEINNEVWEKIAGD